ncbi:MAG TPA: glycosyltransferase family 2 protein [Azospirillaceae bacterium]|nr:glycosyltransferase family 2 protein [Azospirillaceae bacterium]HRQ81374.1 glycosyltransferase family 2 protein [Azospirillaceae bacterium]
MTVSNEPASGISGQPAMPCVAVLIPCHNEALAVATVIQDFRAALPNAAIYVYDNNSTDHTTTVAADAGAIVRREPQQGKGSVVRRMFADVDADVFVLVDGDATYHAASAPTMIDLLRADRLDMVTGRREDIAQAAYRPGHRFGNRLLTGLVTTVFGCRTGDMLSGYRVMSRRFVKSFPALSTGFEIETELTVHALALGLPMADVRTPYAERPEGSASKLRTLRDGWRILRTIITLVQHERPLPLFSAIAGLLFVAAAGLATPLWITWIETGLVPRLPTAVLCASMMVAAMLALVCGLVLDSVKQARREAKRLAYLSVSNKM